MDLLAGVRKEGSRGGRADFKWEDVKQDAHRENYLGHSLMAPVGRWQKNRDLSWYAKGDAPTADAAARERAEELRRIKEAEQDALSEALGFPVDREARERRRMMEEQQRQMEQESGGALAPGEVERAVKEGLVEDRGELGIDGGAKGLGAGKWNGKLEEREVMSGVGVGAPVEKPGKERDRGSKRDRSRSRERRDRDRDRRHRHHHRRERSEEDRTRRRRSRSRSRDRDRERRRRSRSRDGGRAYRRDDDYRRGNIDRRRPRSRSPDRRRGEGRYREDHHERRK